MDVNQFIQASMQGLQQQTASHISIWHLGQQKTWDADQETGILTFAFADGSVASANFQIVGTHDMLSGTFLWGWDHPSVLAPLREHAKLTRAWGVENGVAKFTTREVSCSEDEAWEFTAVTTRLAGANGAYRGLAGTTAVFMTFGEVKLERKQV